MRQRIYDNVFQSIRCVCTVKSGNKSLMMILCEITSGTNANIHLAVVVVVVMVLKGRKVKEILPVMISKKVTTVLRF
jgi:hypothetical protein